MSTSGSPPDSVSDQAPDKALDKAFDKEGFLRDLSAWSPEIAEQIALRESIVLTEAHWQVVEILRNYYQTYHIAPVTRVLIKIVKAALGPEKGNSIYLMQLFTGKAAKISAKIAGLPKPTNCD